jgi:2-polyprenyl-6-methoxyphenol hydroxylase-like FAD-dependent oxidoreductase
MACHQGGYVGLVILENHAIDIACALDRSFVRQQESLPSAVAEVLAQCHLPLPVPLEPFACSHWHGTDALTRKRSKISAQRIFVIGDACGYPEPLTGEGIAWALESAEALVPLALVAIDCWGDDLAARWQQVHGRLVSKRQLRSRLIAYSLRNPLSRRAVVKAISIFPALAQAVAASLTHQPKQSVASK